MGRCWGSKIAGMFFARPAAGGNNVVWLDDIVLASCTNTAAETTILTIPVPADIIADGHRMKAGFILGYRNQSGGLFSFNLKVKLGGITLLDATSNISNTAASLRYNHINFDLIRVGTVAYLATESFTSSQLLIEAATYQSFYTDDLNAYPGNRSAATPFDFTAAQDLIITVTPSLATTDITLSAVQADAQVI